MLLTPGQMVRSWTIRLLFVGIWVTAPRPANAAIVERIVAVVEERAILLSELRQRAAPYLIRIHREVSDDAQRAAAISQLYKAILNRMIEEELQHRAAAKANISISPKEVDEALRRVADQNDVAVEEVIAEAQRSGLPEAQYRSELRHQVLEAKLLNLRVQGRIRITDADLLAMYRKLQVAERSELGFQAAQIVISGASGSPNERIKQRRLAERVAAMAARGVDFESLARRYSDDVETRGQGGLLPRTKPGSLPLRVDQALLHMEVGDTSPVLRDGESWVIVKLVARDPSSLPAFEDAKPQLQNRLYMEKMDKARRHWLDSLRRRSHVEVRL